MAGQLSASMAGFKENVRVGARSSYLPLQYNGYQPEWESQTIKYRPPINENAGRERLKTEFQYMIDQTPERKPQPFHYQQDKILTFRPPVFNDVYSLDVNDIALNKNSQYGQVNRRDDAYLNLKDYNYVNNLNRVVNKEVNTQKFAHPTPHVYQRLIDSQQLKVFRETDQTFLNPKKVELLGTSTTHINNLSTTKNINLPYAPAQKPLHLIPTNNYGVKVIRPEFSVDVKRLT